MLSFIVSEMTNLDGMGGQADMVNNTTHDSSTKYNGYTKCLIESNELNIETYFKYDNAYNISELLATTTLQSVTVTYPTTPGIVFECNGYVSSYEALDPFDDLMGLSINIKISGKPTISQT